MGSAPPREAADLQWSERPWARRLRGGRGRTLGVALLTLLLAGVVGGEETRPLRRLALACFDAYQRALPRVRAAAPVVIVEIDEKSLARHGQWPWPRSLLGRLVSTVADGRPAAIGLDLVMPEADRLSPDRLRALVAELDPDLARRLGQLPRSDETLARALSGRPVVLGAAGFDPPEPAGRPSAGRFAPVRVLGEDPRPFVRRFDAVLRSRREIDEAAAGHGLLNADAEAGVVRRVPLLAAVGDVLTPSLALDMLRVAGGAPAWSVWAGRSGVTGVGVRDWMTRTELDGSVWIHFTRSDPARFVSAAAVLASEPLEQSFEGRLVLIGVTALGLSDDKATPVADRMAGVEIHAQLLEGIVGGDLLSRPPVVRWAGAAVLGAGGLLLVLVVPRMAARRSAALLALLIGVVGALGVVLYVRFHLLFDAATPSLGLGLIYTATLGVALAEADSQRRALRRQVARQREAALRLAGELEAARRIQMGILPTPAAAFPGESRFELWTHLEPAREVGGDLYDFFRLDADRAWILVGDVSGKGLPGSLFMALSKSLCKSIALRCGGDVGRAMDEANVEISRDNAEGLFVTVWAAVLDAGAGRIDFVNAGHGAPYLLSAGAPPDRLDGPGGPPLCVVEDWAYEAGERRLRPGETLCLVTDGVTDAANPAGEFYGRARLEALLSGLGAAPTAAAVGDAICRDVSAFTAGAEPTDDIAILVLRWHGPA